MLNVSTFAKDKVSHVCLNCSLTVQYKCFLIDLICLPLSGVVILLVKNKDDSMRLWVNYQQLNRVTVKNKYSFPRIDDLLGYHLCRIKSKNIPKIGFRTYYGHYEYLIMSFGLTNAFDILMDYMNRTFQSYLNLNKFVVVFIDDILVYSRTIRKHDENLRNVLQILREKKLFAKLENEVEIILSWEQPKTITQLRKFEVYSFFLDKGLGIVLMQEKKENKIHEDNYLTHNLALATIVFDLKLWRHHLYGVKLEGAIKKARAQKNHLSFSKVDDRTIFFQGRLCVPKDDSLKSQFVNKLRTPKTFKLVETLRDPRVEVEKCVHRLCNGLTL
ncbi:hypothetical protein CR513_08786, partial [Mucuna pruriens]